ncbi:hypothetical protein B0T16DRAFT_150356 [Cercophora newfieldiana]|uniref:Uncharacterized protein n=1 Tax=Cercophora newfieldiana TaxID=92897 RepID=A0AA39Y4N2_9PEZI|nr:hypothetical protein B0T16DRAFT_150356 [Cercophora newfieldiana]
MRTVCTSDDVDDFLCRRWGVRVSVPRHIPLSDFLSVSHCSLISSIFFSVEWFSLVRFRRGVVEVYFLLPILVRHLHFKSLHRHGTSGNNGGQVLGQRVSHWSSRNGTNSRSRRTPNNPQHTAGWPMWRKEIRGCYFPSPCLISYSTPTDFINGLLSLSVKSPWDGDFFPLHRPSQFINFLDFSRIPCSIYNLFCVLFPHRIRSGFTFRFYFLVCYLSVLEY